MARVLVHHHLDAPREQVFDHFAEHENLRAFFGVPVTRLQDGDDGGRNGVGSRRRMAGGPLAFEETTTVADRPSKIEYRITKGTPLSHHRGELTFTDGAAGGTDVRYLIELGARVPGLAQVVALALTASVKRGFRGLRL